MKYTCNLCGSKNESTFEDLTREAKTCVECKSSERIRSIAFYVSEHIYGKGITLVECELKKHTIVSGLSDDPCYADHFSRLFDYTNTFYHQRPFLNILEITEDQHEKLNVLISADVFEHVGHPIQTAFDNSYHLLKSGGMLMLTVPFTLFEDSIEHFPDLYDYKITKIDNEYILENKTRNGETQTFKDLIFHGGAGETLEIRVFSEKALRKHLEDAGFVDICFHREPVLEFGITIQNPCSVPITAKKVNL